MTSTRNLRLTNQRSVDPVLNPLNPHTSSMSHDRPTNSDHSTADQRIKLLEELLNKQNSRFAQLENRVDLLEKLILSQRDQIKNLEGQLTRISHSTDAGRKDSVASARVEATSICQTPREDQSERNVHARMSPRETAANDARTEIEHRTFINTTNANAQKEKQESKEVVTEKLQSLNLNDSNEKGNRMVSTISKATSVPSVQIRFMPSYLLPVGPKGQDPKKHNANNTEISGPKDPSLSLPTTVPRTQNSTMLVLKDYSVNDRAVESRNDGFVEWLDSRQRKVSLWADERYRRSLLSYIAKIYDQRGNIGRFVPRLRIEHNQSAELEQLLIIVNEFEKQPGARKALQENRMQTRSTSRFTEIKILFEYHLISPEERRDLRILEPSDVEEIIDRQTIRAYFDMLPRPGFTTADIGEYLQLKKENIFGGTEHPMSNDRITHVDVDLKKSTIDLVDNRVDLITALVVLHHIPQVDRILAEFVRILRPDGYLIIREHNCKDDRSLPMKYLHFVHAFMLIARVDELADEPNSSHGNDPPNWKELKSRIVEYTSSIHYRTRDDWQEKLVRLGFELRAILEYGEAGSNNPQELYFGIYQLRKK